MSKRTATSELTDRNWDHEDEPEEAGVFAKATDDALKGRQIIKARRRNPDDGTNGKSAFSGFGGFAFTPTQTSTPTFASGFQNIETKIQADEKKQSEKTNEIFDVNISPNKPLIGSSVVVAQNGSGALEHNLYLSNLKALNQSVITWITQHVDKNPYCILSPIFKDYDKHLCKLEMEKQKMDTKGNGNVELRKDELVTPNEENNTAFKTGLTFGMKIMSTQPTASSIGINLNAATTTAATGFNFAVGTSQVAKVVGSENNEEEYVPPKVETVEHKEEGSLYNTKCKLFYHKDKAWLERGIGFLYLKKINDIPQLLVRADNTLGNILLNIRLSESIIKSLSRQGNNNVCMMCVPNPPIPKIAENKLLMMLIHVKTGEDADMLLGKIKEMLLCANVMSGSPAHLQFYQ